MTETTSTIPTCCETCGARREQRTCDDCGLVADVIDCPHYGQPAEIAASAHGGQPTCETCEAIRSAIESRDADEVARAYRLLSETERDEVEEAAHLVLLHTRAVGGIGQTGEEQRMAAAAVEALSDRTRKLGAAAVPAWQSAISDLWLTATAEGLDPATDDPEAVIGDDDEMWDVQRLVIVSDRADRLQLATSVQAAIAEEGR